MDDSDFMHTFLFRNYRFKNYKYTDNRDGAHGHYFAYMITGHARLVTDTDTVVVAQGDVFYIPAKSSYQSYWYGQPEIRFISLGFSLLPHNENRVFPTQVIEADDDVRGMLLRLGEVKTPTARDIADFYALAARFIPAMERRERGEVSPLVRRVEAYLQNHPFAKTATVAKAMAVSEPSLYNAFRKASDVSLNEMRNRIIAEKARDLLITTDRSVEEISDLLGFSSTSYFRKSLRRHFDMTPREIRKTIKI